MTVRWWSERGNSLAEVMVSVVIVAIAAAGTTGGMVFTTNVVGENSLEQSAIVLAQQSLERLRTTPYAEIESGTEISPDRIYTVVRTVEENVPEEGMKHITATVRWTWKGQPRRYELATVFAKLTKS
jgi:prepilin-type N-terminal cleavage/methylation domain-containing protein